MLLHECHCLCDTAWVLLHEWYLHVWYTAAAVIAWVIFACVIYCCCYYCMSDIARVIFACVILLLLYAWYLLVWYCCCCMRDISFVVCMILLLLYAWYCLHDCMRVTGIVAAAAYLYIFWYYKSLSLSILYCSKWFVAGSRLNSLQETKFPVMCNHYAIQCSPFPPHLPTSHLHVTICFSLQSS